MSVSVKLPVEFQGIYENLFKQNPEEGTINLVINELRRRLAEYKLMDKMFHDRYKMELAIDGIKTIRAQLKKLAKYS